MTRGLCREAGHVWSTGLAETRCVTCGKPRAVGEPLDLDAISREHLTQCGPHDYGVDSAGCNCSTADPRPVIARLVDEVQRLRALTVDAALHGYAYEYTPAGGPRLMLSPADVKVYVKQGYVDELAGALKVVREAEAWRDRVAGLILGSHELPLRDAVDEWRARQGGQQ